MEETSLPSEFGEAAFVLKTGWTHQDYEDAPDELIRQMAMLMNAEAEVTRAKVEETAARSKARR